ncbi:hypothetical protein MAR_002071 [Mya arenaria]|uniref:Uncharacterized protein n=1 Tax=Mya arenaria TaxID=6604 RepID=A0ABY7FDH8_MYAAR|nr:hypothetical protein MAR_002071 [Mya arenaria]
MDRGLLGFLVRLLSLRTYRVVIALLYSLVYTYFMACKSIVKIICPMSWKDQQTIQGNDGQNPQINGAWYKTTKDLIPAY